MASNTAEISALLAELEGRNDLNPEQQALVSELRARTAPAEPQEVNYGRMGAEMLGGSIGATAALVAGQMGPQALTPEEIYTVPVASGVGSAAAAKTYDFFAGLFSPNEDHKSAAEQIGQSGMDFMSGAVGASAGDELARMAGNSLRRVVGAGSDAVAQAFRTMGIEPTVGAVGSKTIASIENALARLPFSSDIVGREYQRVLSGMDDFSNKWASRLSNDQGKEAVGGTIRKGVKNFVGRWKSKAEELYDAIPIDPGAKVNPGAYYTQLSGMSKRFSSDPEYADLIPSDIRSLAAKMDKTSQGPMTWSTMKSIRTAIGRKIEVGKLSGNEAQADLKTLYAALSDDMARIAAENGEKSLNAYKRANKYWAAGSRRIDEVLEPLVKSGIQADVYNAGFRGAKDSPQRLRAIKRSLEKPEWDAVVAQTIRDMGKVRPGQAVEDAPAFSPAEFVTNYEKLARSGADKVMFGGEKYRGLDLAMKNLRTASSALKEASKLANSSNTASTTVYMTMLTGGIGQLSPDMATTAVNLGLATLTPPTIAKLMTSPKFVNWLAEGVSTPTTQQGISAHLGRLSSIAASEEDGSLAEAYSEYLESLRGAAQ